MYFCDFWAFCLCSLHLLVLIPLQLIPVSNHHLEQPLASEEVIGES